jgi:hypothetical protein
MQAEVKSEQSRYWVGVVSATHIKLGVQGGFAQHCHGKSAPLKRMRPGDWLVYYSPRLDFAQAEPLQAFTAIGQVEDDRIYEYVMSDSFVPYRRNIRYMPCREVKIALLLEKLSFTQGTRNWGYRFRTGHSEIEREDFLTIAGAMLEDVGGVPVDSRR